LLFACVDSEGARARRDQSVLRRLALEDQVVQTVLRDADVAEREKRWKDAADVLESKAIPAQDKAIAASVAPALESAWGRRERDELVAEMRDRRAEMMSSAAAIRADDFAKTLESLERQIDVEKRAIKTHDAIVAGPDSR
jgi:hypothetical protein